MDENLLNADQVRDALRDVRLGNQEALNELIRKQPATVLGALIVADAVREHAQVVEARLRAIRGALMHVAYGPGAANDEAHL
jgi:hypothetical protein